MGIVNKDGALYFATGVDNTGLYKGLDQAQGRIDEYEGYIKKASVAIGSYFAFSGVKDLTSDIIRVRGEMQMLENSFEVLLGGRREMEGMLASIKEYAVVSPLSLKGVSNAVQTLLGFNVEAERIIPIIKQIGDISMGNEERFKSLTLAFAQMSATGRLMGQDLLQMINAGFNPLQEIAKKTGKSISDLKKSMEDGAISAEMVSDAFRSATEEGGKFFGMTEKQAKGIEGLKAQLEGAFQEMYNELGKGSEEFITSAYQGAIKLVENYEKIGKILTALLTTYGAYRTAVILTISAEKGWTVSQLANYRALLLVEKAQKLLNATMIANPYVAVTALVVGLVAAMWAFSDSTTAAEKAQKKLSEGMQEITDAVDSRKNKSEELLSIIKDETQTENARLRALKDIQALYPGLFGNMDIEAIKLSDEIKLKKERNILDEEYRKSLLSTKISESKSRYDELKKEISLLENGASGRTAFGKKRSESLREEWRAVGSEVIGYINKLRSLENANTMSTGKTFSSISDEIQKASEKIKTLKTDISDLRSGKTKAEADTTVKGEIEKKMKELKAEEEAYAILTGKDAKIQKTATGDLQKLYDELLQLQQKAEQSRIDIMADGADKRLAQINHDYEREISTIEELVKKWRKAQNGQLTMEQTAAYDENYQLAFEKRLKAEKEAYDESDKLRSDQANKERQSWVEYNKAYGDYQAKRLAIVEDYTRQIDNATTGGENAMLEKQRDEALQALDRSMLEQSDLWVNLFEDASRQSSAFLQRIIDDTQNVIDFIKGKEGAILPEGISEEWIKNLDLKDLESLFDGLIKKRNELNSRNPFGQLIKGFKDLKAAATDSEKQMALSDISQSAQGAASIVGDLGNVMKSVFGESASKDIDNVTKSVQGLIGVGTGAAKMLAGDFSGIVDILQGLPSLIDGIAGLFGGGNNDAKLQKQIDYYEKIVSLYDKLIDKQKEYLSALTGTDATKQAEEVENMINRQLAAAQKSLEAWFQTGKSWNHHSMGYRLNRDLGKELGITSASDIFKWEVSDWKELQRNIELWAKLPEEVQAYGEAVIGAKEDIESLGDALNEAWSGLSFDSLKDSLDDIVTMADMTFESISDSFEDHMSKAVLHMVKSQYLNEALKDWYAGFAEAAKDNVFTQSEADALHSYYEQIATTANNLYKQAMDMAGIDITKPDDPSSDNSLKGALSKASQESIDLLAGQTGAQRVAIEDIRAMMKSWKQGTDNEYVRAIHGCMSAVYALQITGWKEVSAIRLLSEDIKRTNQIIADQSKEIKELSKSIEDNTGETASSLSNMEQNGIKVNIPGL